MLEHGSNSKPYDCNLCPEKFYFRAELDHHLVDHDLREMCPPKSENDHCSPKDEAAERKSVETVPQGKSLLLNEVKQEIIESNPNQPGDDDEYIEVEKLHDNNNQASSKVEQRDEDNESNIELLADEKAQ